MLAMLEPAAACQGILITYDFASVGAHYDRERQMHFRFVIGKVTSVTKFSDRQEATIEVLRDYGYQDPFPKTLHVIAPAPHCHRGLTNGLIGKFGFVEKDGALHMQHTGWTF